MSDHERGAYSPQTDAPLAFDARQSRGGGFPTTLVISLIVLVVLIGAIVLFYRSGIRSAGAGPGPVGAPVGEIKSPPPPGAQPSDQATGLQIYKSETQPAASSAPPAAFAPPPEQPQPRPVAPVAAQPSPPPRTAPAPAPKPAPTAAATAAAIPPPAGAAHAPKDEIGALLDKSTQAAPTRAVSAPAPAKPVKPSATSTAASAQGSGTTAQIGAYSSEDLAVSGWNNLATAFSADMTGKGQHFEPVKTADGKTLYRATVTGFGSHAAAVAFCAKLKAASHPCIVR